MAAGDLIVRTFQAELNGLLMGAGTDYQIGGDGVDGFGLPDVRDSDTARPQAHGVFVGQDYMSAKPLNWPIEVLGASASDAEELLIALEEAWRVVVEAATVPLVFRLAGTRLYRVNGKPRRLAVDAKNLKAGAVKVVAQFVATDPRVYDNALQTGSAGPGSTTSGLSLPHGFPHGFGSSSPGFIVVTNDGNVETFPTATVTVGAGGIAGFTISKVESGESFGVTLNLLESDVITIDFLEKTVLLNDTASRIGNVDRPDSVWLDADPGSTTWSFTISGGGTATLDLAWRSAFNL